LTPTALTTARARNIPELLQIHLEELEFLWARRRIAPGSRELTARDYTELNERVEAHIQGLLAVRDALPALLVQRLAEGERDAIFAAACPLLRLNDRALAEIVIQRFATAEGEVLAGLRDALSVAPSSQTLTAMQSQFDSADAPHAVAAAVVLANQRLLKPTAARLGALLRESDPAVAQFAWLAATCADVRDPAALPERPFREALEHESPQVRGAALRAAAWTGQDWTVPAAIEFAQQGDQVALAWLAALGAVDDFPVLHPLILKAPGAEDRCALLSRCGHPAALDQVVGWLEAEDLALAAAAGEAFTRITGADVRGHRKTMPVAPDADDFAKEFAPDVWIPDPAKAQAYLKRYGAIIATGTRWRAGVDVGGECTPEALARVDLEARWDMCARAALARAPTVPPPPIH